MCFFQEKWSQATAYSSISVHAVSQGSVEKKNYPPTSTYFSSHDWLVSLLGDRKERLSSLLPRKHGEFSSLVPPTTDDYGTVHIHPTHDLQNIGWTLFCCAPTKLWWILDSTLRSKYIMDRTPVLCNAPYTYTLIFTHLFSARGNLLWPTPTHVFRRWEEPGELRENHHQTIQLGSDVLILSMSISY